MLHKQMQPLPALPQFRVMRRFPGTDSEVGQIADAPLTVCHIRSVRQRDFAPPFFIPKYIKYLPAIYYDARTGHRNHLRASTFQGKRSGTPGDLAAVPHLPVMPDNPVLRDVAVRVAPIGSNVRIAACIGTHAGLVYQFRILRNAAGILCITQTDGQIIFLAICLIPCYAIVKGTGVA